jgi:poly(3-hydroxybutyrate) depolymerase
MDVGIDSGGPDAAADVGSDIGPTASDGCVDGSGIPEGENTFMLEGRSRRFIVRLPNGYSGERPWPLVLALHGNGGSASYWDGTSGDRNIRGVLQDDAILVIAEAIEGNWRDYDADPSTWPARIEEELMYFDAILTQARAELCIDEDAIFSMGFSGGGSFSGVLGCRRTDIRAIAVGGSVIYFDEANCVGTPAAWVTIGTEELTSGREAYRDFFRDRASCAETTMPTDPEPCVAYDGCGEGTPVHYCQHPDGHIWPDFGSEAMWTFFEQFVD